MELKEFIPILECALKCSDESIVEVSQNPANDNEIRVFLDDGLGGCCITVGMGEAHLLDVLNGVTFAVMEAHRENQKTKESPDRAQVSFQEDQEKDLRQQRLQAMRQAISITFERSLKSDLYLQAAQRGQKDFNFLLDSNIPAFADSVLGLYQRIFDEVINVNPSLQ